MVLAAGLGSRLRPLTDVLPKPLVPVGDRPALAHVLERLSAAGLDRVVVNAHHGLEPLQRFLAGHPRVATSVEPELLGTAGGVARAGALLGPGDVLIWNADILAAVDPAAVIAAHADARTDPRRRAATLVVQPRERGSGSVGIDGGGRVVRLRKERVGQEERGGEFLGIHVLGDALRKSLPERGCLIGDVYIPALRSGATLQAFEWRAPFFDIGSVKSYLEANLAWLASRGLSSWIAPAAVFDPGITLEAAILGEGASARGVGLLERCVVWPGASVEAPLADAVVAPGHIVRAGAVLKHVAPP
jgi:mannose-1-phosphate guanylyltransferase